MPSHYKVIGSVSEPLVARAIEAFEQLGFEVQPGTAIEYPGDRKIRLRWITSDCDKCEEAVCSLKGMTIMLQHLLTQDGPPQTVA